MIPGKSLLYVPHQPPQQPWRPRPQDRLRSSQVLHLRRWRSLHRLRSRPPLLRQTPRCPGFSGTTPDLALPQSSTGTLSTGAAVLPRVNQIRPQMTPVLIDRPLIGYPSPSQAGASPMTGKQSCSALVPATSPALAKQPMVGFVHLRQRRGREPGSPSRGVGVEETLRSKE